MPSILTDQAMRDMNKPFQVMCAPIISDLHIKPATRLMISEDRNALGLHRIVYGRGALVFAHGETALQGNDDYEDIPADLADCIRWAWSEGFEWLRFDLDGDVIASLPVFEAD
ncbi:hypothetical protein MASR1M8_25350 [Thermomonas brevis]